MNTRTRRMLMMAKISYERSNEQLLNVSSTSDLDSSTEPENFEGPPDASTTIVSSTSEADDEKDSGSEYKPSGSDTNESSCDGAENSKDSHGFNFQRSSAMMDEEVIVPDSSTELDTAAINNEAMNMTSNISSSFTVSDSDTSNTGIQIRASRKNEVSGSRVRNKKYSCFICQKIVLNLSRHFKTIHENDTVIARILALANRSKERRNEFAKLVRVGNFYHNCEVLKFKKGELFLLRLPTPHERTKYSYVDYGPCPNCLGFMLKKHLAVHMKSSCPERTSCNGSRKPISESNSILNGIFGMHVSSDFRINIINRMKNDEITSVCKEDELILKFGVMQYEKYSTTQAELIRQSMRQLGRLFVEIKIIHPKLKTLADALIPQNFDLIVRATKNLCVSHTPIACRPHFETPSLALKLGHSVKKCISFERGTALRRGDLKRNEELVSLMSLMDLEWSIRISSNALNTLYTRKLNCTELLPVTGDLIKLNNYLDEEMTKYQKEIELHNQPSPKTWTIFASVTLSRIIIFNKRRSGETARMKIDHYAMRPLWHEQATEELRNSLSPFEKVLAKYFAIVEVPGKRGKKVPILLTPGMKNAVDLLIKTRMFAGVAKENPFIFARTNGSTEHMRGHDCLRRCCDSIQLSSPETINGTRLRKYVATVSQIINLTENETDWLAKHLGHDVRVHRNFYRLQENAVELTKISRVLLAVDSGDTHQFSGKKLDEVELSELPGIIEDEEAEEAVTVEQEKPSSEGSANEVSGGSAKGVSEGSAKEVKNKPVIRRSSKKRPWSMSESEGVVKFFRSEIRRETVPGKARCEECIENNPVLSNRNWKDVKYYVKNYLSRIKKQKQK